MSTNTTGNTTGNTTNYRLSLPAASITYLLHLAKNDYVAANGNETAALAVIAKLSVYETKIANAGIGVAYSTKPAKASLLASLGGEVPATAGATFDKEAYWQECYALYAEAGYTWSTLSITEIEAAREHMYLHDLFNPEELAQFEGRAESTEPTNFNSPETTNHD